MSKGIFIAGGVRMFISSEARQTYQVLLDEIDKHGEPVCAQSDPDAFFPEKGEAVAAAKKICKACPLKEICLEFSLVNQETHGIWGGVAYGERRRLVKRRYT